MLLVHLQCLYNNKYMYAYYPSVPDILSEVNLEKFCMFISIQKKENASLLGDNFPKKRMEIFLIKTKTPKGNECFNSLVHQGVDCYLKMYSI